MRPAMERRAEGRPNYIVLLTDGLPTAGVTDLDQILKNVAAERRGSMPRRASSSSAWATTWTRTSSTSWRWIVAALPPTCAPRRHRGQSHEFLRQDLPPDAHRDQRQLRWPDHLRCAPQELPDLFFGSQIVALGRYDARTCGTRTVTLSGQTPAGSKSFEVRTGSRRKREQGASPRSGRRASGLAARPDPPTWRGQELVDEIVRLGAEYGILTSIPHSSHRSVGYHR